MILKIRYVEWTFVMNGYSNGKKIDLKLKGVLYLKDLVIG